MPTFRLPPRSSRSVRSRAAGPSRARAGLAGLLGLLVLGACNMHTTVEVDVEEDGSGAVTVTVALDADALARVPDLDGDGASDTADLASLVRVDDLAAVGWSVDDPVASAGGGATVRVSRSFGTPAEAVQILDEVTGPDGALRDMAVDRSTSFGRTELEVTGTIDLSGGLEAFGDEGLAAALDGEPLGEDAGAIAERLGQPLAEAVTFEVVADLDGEDHAWSPRLGDQPEDIAAARTFWNLPALVLAGVAVGAALALVGLLVARLLRS